MRVHALQALRAAALVAALFAAKPGQAVQPDEVLQNRALEDRARTISGGLRCLVCQNQSIDDSDAPLARDLRLLVRERLKQGDSDGEVSDFVVARYGEFVLLKPVFAPHTLILWLTPLLVLVLGAFGIRAARRAGPALPAALTDEERRALDRVLNEREPAQGK